MKTVRMTLDEDLVKAVDAAVARLGTTRSAFARDALRRALRDHRTRLLEKKHRRGYATIPVAADEFPFREDDLEWGEP